MRVKDNSVNRGRAMEALMRTYFDGCNEADTAKIEACFIPEAIHYFPPGMYEGPFRGAQTIARKWRSAVETLGSYWTVDRIVTHPLTHEAVMEWTHFKTKAKTVLRGVEWYDFDAQSGLIKEIRAYYAAPQSAEVPVSELGSFPYGERGYALGPPRGARS